MAREKYAAGISPARVTGRPRRRPHRNDEAGRRRRANKAHAGGNRSKADPGRKTERRPNPRGRGLAGQEKGARWKASVKYLGAAAPGGAFLSGCWCSTTCKVAEEGEAQPRRSQGV